MKNYDVYNYEGFGFEKIFNFNSWKIAILNFMPGLDDKPIDYLECHTKTEEAFIILEGTCRLYFFENNQPDSNKFIEVDLIKNHIYRVYQNVYHNHRLSEDAKILIIEEDQTSNKNSIRIKLSETQMHVINKKGDSKMKYELLLEEKFNDETQLNPKIWNIVEGGHGFGNQESQFYTKRKKNIFIKNNMLHIVAHKENYKHRQYTSARINTKNKLHIQYGKIEVRAKIPVGKGTWPAIWLLGENIDQVNWPTCGEIDLMEHVGKDLDRIHYSIHSKSYNFQNGKHKTFDIYKKGITDDFHTYSIVWKENSISYYLDDEFIVKYDKKNHDDNYDWPFNQPFYLLINLAIGGQWGGEIDQKIFPVEFIIDSVKIYKGE